MLGSVADPILIETLQTGLVLIKLNRPERRNALSIELLEGLCDRLESLALNSVVRVAILCGAGSNFSSGLDLREASNPDLAQRSASSVARALQLLRSTPIVTIAAAHGAAYAGGAGLMAACDVAIGTSDLKISFPEARRGLLPALICSVLSQKIREGDLRELFLVGHTIDADRAHQIGLLQRIVAPDKLLDEALEIGKQILAGGPQTIIAIKRLLDEAYPPASAVSIPQMLEAHLEIRRSPEAKEGLAAYNEKRPPRWMN